MLLQAVYLNVLLVDFVVLATFIPQRYVLGILGLFAQANSFSMRMTLSMTISQMVERVASSSQQITGGTCPDPNNFTESTVNHSITTLTHHVLTSKHTGAGADEVHVPSLWYFNAFSFLGNRTESCRTVTDSLEDELQRDYQLYDWSESTQGFILSSFYYGYIFAHLPAGLLAEKFGGKWVVVFGLLLTSFSTLTIPWFVQIGGATGLIIMRIFQAIGEGTVTPSLLVMISRWVPPAERSLFSALVFGGAQTGNVVGPYLSGLILGAGYHWSAIYYVFGMLGVAWCIFWTLLCYNTPNDHPFISEQEKSTLNKTVVSSTLRKKLDPVPLRAILLSVPLWALVIAYVGHAFGHILMITVLPKYFLDVLKFNIKETGLMTALPFIAMYISSFIFGALCDLAIKKNWHSVEMGRKINVTLSSGVAGVFMMLASYSGCDRTQAVGYLVASMALMGAFYCSTKINSIDLAPNYSGTGSSIIITIASLSGILAPSMVGLLTPDQTVAQWRVAFWVIFVLLIGSNLVYVVWGKAEQQWWDDVEQFGYPPTWKWGPFQVRAVSEKGKSDVYSDNSTVKVGK